MNTIVQKYIEAGLAMLDVEAMQRAEAEKLAEEAALARWKRYTEGVMEAIERSRVVPADLWPYLSIKGQSYADWPLMELTLPECDIISFQIAKSNGSMNGDFNVLGKPLGKGYGEDYCYREAMDHIASLPIAIAVAYERRQAAIEFGEVE